MSDDHLPSSLKRGHALGDSGEDRSESFEENLRRIWLVAVTAIWVWGLVTATRRLCETGFGLVMSPFEAEKGPYAWLILLLALTLSGVVRGVLVQWQGWDKAQGDGMGMAPGRFHLTYEREGMIRPPLPETGSGLCFLRPSLCRMAMKATKPQPAS